MTAVPAAVTGLWPGSRISRRPGRSGLLVLPSLRRPRMLVPTGVPAARVMLTRNSTSRRQTIGQEALAAGIRTGILTLLPVARVVGDGVSTTIEDHVRGLVPEVARLGVLLGPPRANAKPVLQAFAVDGRTVAFGKVGHDATSAALVRREGEVLEDSALHALEHVEVPDVVSTEPFGALTVLLLSPMSSAQSRGASWELPLVETHEVAESAGTSRGAVVTSEYWAELVRRGDVLETGGNPGLAALLGEVAPLVAATSLGFGRWHGDWSPWNMGRAGGRLQVWDWEQSRVGVPLGLDAAHFSMQCALRRGEDAGDAVRSLLGEATHALARWYPAGEQVEVTVLLYVAEITERYLAQAGTTPQLARRLSLLEEVAAGLVARRRAALAAEPAGGKVRRTASGWST